MTSWAPSVLAWVRFSGTRSRSEAGSNYWRRSDIRHITADLCCKINILFAGRGRILQCPSVGRGRGYLWRSQDAQNAAWPVQGEVRPFDDYIRIPHVNFRNSSQNSAKSIKCDSAIGLEEFNFLMVLGKGSFGKVKFYLVLMMIS